MLDINLILNNTDDVKTKLESRGFKLNIDLILKFSTERKKLIGIKESLAAEKNKISDKFKKLTSDQDKKNLKSKPDCALVLAWNFFEEIKKNNGDLADKFISIKDLEI